MWLIILLAMAVSWPARAVTVAEVPELVRRQNRTVKALATDVSIEREEKSIARSRFYPVLEWKTRFTRLDDDVVIDIGPKTISRDILGGQLNVAIEVDPPPFKVQDKNVRNSHLLLTQPLYAGGRITAGLDAAEAKIDEAELQQTRGTQDAVAVALERYFQVRLADELTHVLEGVGISLDAMEKVAQSLVATGMAPEFQTLQIKVAKAELVAKLTEARTSARLARDAFRAAAGIDDLHELAFESALKKVKLPPTKEMFMAAALKRRPELAILAAKEAQVRALKQARTGEMLPTVYAFGKYELMPEELTMIEPKWAIGVGIDVPLTKGLSQFPERAKAARLLDKIAILKEEAGQLIPLEVEKYFTECENKEAQLVAIESGVAMAEEALRLAQVRLKAGKGSSVEVLKASTDRERLAITRWQLVEQLNRNLIQLYRAAGDVGEYVALYTAS